MGFLSPKPPQPATPANTAINAMAPASTQTPGQALAAASLISTSGQGLTTKANGSRTSLLGGS